MKKLLNKLGGSGKFEVDALKEDEHVADDEQFEDVHYRKSTTLPADPRDNAEDIKPARKGSLTRKVLSPRASKGIPISAMDFEDSDIKKRSSKELPKDKDKDKLNESDDKMFRKSFSLKSVSLFNKSSELKNSGSDSPIRSPSLKGMFSSYEQQKDGPLVDMEGSDEELNEDAEVPQTRSILGTRNDPDLYSAPVRVPSAPARIATSPIPKGSKSPMSSSPAPASLHMINSPPGSPTFVGNSSSPRVVPTFSPTPTAPPPQALKPSPMVLVADDFDAHFGRVRTESITDDYGTPFKSEYDRNRTDSVSEDADVDLDHDLMQDKPKGGLFSSFGTNKPKKLK